MYFSHPLQKLTRVPLLVVTPVWFLTKVIELAGHENETLLVLRLISWILFFALTIIFMIGWADKWPHQKRLISKTLWQKNPQRAMLIELNPKIPGVSITLLGGVKVRNEIVTQLKELYPDADAITIVTNQVFGETTGRVYSKIGILFNE